EHDAPGVNADADADGFRAACVEVSERLQARDGSAHGAVGVLEERHDGVADELVDEAAVRRDRGLELAEERVDEGDRLFRAYALDQRSERADVEKEDAQLALDLIALLNIGQLFLAEQREELGGHEAATGLLQATDVLVAAAGGVGEREREEHGFDRETDL